MNKTELIDHIAKQADISKAAAGQALEALVRAVRTTLRKGGTVTLVGFGVRGRQARGASGRNRAPARRSRSTPAVALGRR